MISAIQFEDVGWHHEKLEAKKKHDGPPEADDLIYWDAKRQNNIAILGCMDHDTCIYRNVHVQKIECR